ncbi:response regulator [Oligoflexia bacterium]|nr:response regulator [Oligoflexia bacterium]
MDNTSSPYVLLADDDVAARQLMETFCAKEGWRCDIAQDGEGALRASSSTAYDIVITDLVMPDIMGIELLKKIREQRPGQAIIVVSGSQRIEDSSEVFREGGALDFIEKPVDFTVLKESVTRILAGRRQKKLEDTLHKYVKAERITYEFLSHELAEAQPALVLAERLFAAGKINLNTKLRMDLAFQEAVANALEHGNLELQSEWKHDFDDRGVDKFSRTKRERLRDSAYSKRKIWITVEYVDQTISIAIKDEGKGFGHEQQKGPSSTVARLESTLQLHGRGVTIITGIMDEVTYADGGSKITMIKRVV